MRLAVGIPVWQDYDLILRTIRSLQPLEPDLIVVADGWIRDVVNPAGGIAGLPAIASSEERMRALSLTGPPPCRWVSIEIWRSQSEKRTVILDEARLAGCDWLLQIDADEQLHNGELLRPMLEHVDAGFDVFPVPFEYAPGEWYGTLWKCVRVAAWRRWIAASDLLEHVDGTAYQVVTDGNRAPHAAELAAADLRRGLPWISHHADERPAGRRAIRLGELEHSLEPLPANPPRPAYPTLDARPIEQVSSAA